MELASWASRGAILGSLWGLLGPSWGPSGQKLHLGALFWSSWCPGRRRRTIFEHENRALERPRAAPRRENRYFTRVSCMSAFQPQSRPKSEESAPERLRSRLGTQFSAKNVILQGFWLGHVCLRYRFRMRFFKHFSKNAFGSDIVTKRDLAKTFVK